MHRTIHYIIAALLSFALFGTQALAGGFGSGLPFGGQAKALAKNYVKLTSHGGRVKFRTRGYARVSHTVIAGGKVITATAEAGVKFSLKFKGAEVCVECSGGQIKFKQNTIAKTKIFAKGGNILAKAYAKGSFSLKGTDISVTGKHYAYAAGRFTPLGTQTASGVTSSHNVIANGPVKFKVNNVARTSIKIKSP